MLSDGTWMRPIDLDVNLLIQPPLTSTLFPYTTLFRSSDPTVLLQNAYGWGTPDFDGHELMSTLSALRSEEHTSELQSLRHLVCRLLLEKKKESPEQTTTTGSPNNQG